jgi:hypothetical protein
LRRLLHNFPSAILPDNGLMPSGPASKHCACRAKRLFVFSLLAASLLCVSIALAASATRTKPSATLDPEYGPALATADHFLQAWQSADIENGMALLTERAKENMSRDNLDKFFLNESAVAYEIDHGKALKRGRWEFPVLLIVANANDHRSRRRFSTIVVVNTGHNEWAVDKLP